MYKKVSLFDVRAALRDGRFRETLPADLTQDIQKYLHNPSCSCNMPLYKRVFTECRQQLKDYFPKLEVTPNPPEEELPENRWSVINCNVTELESYLKKLPPGRKQLALTRFEDKVTVVVNELDY